jgi:hypothetical protein
MDVLAGKTYFYKRQRCQVICVIESQARVRFKKTNHTQLVPLDLLQPTRETTAFFASKKTKSDIQQERRQKDKLAKETETIEIDLAWKEPVPTTHAPGTPEKIQVMMLRYANRELIHHELDEPGDFEPVNLGYGILKF